MIRFKEWIKKKKFFTDAIYDGTKSPDFQWQGAPPKPKKKNKRKKK